MTLLFCFLLCWGMAGKSRLPKLALSPGQLSDLQQLTKSQTAPLREVQRARILCRYHAGETIAGIARAMDLTRKSARKWIDKALAMGAEAALKDAYHLSLIHISEPTRLGMISYAVFCLKK